MSLFMKRKSSYVGIYLLYDPAVPDTACKFSPPFFSPADDLACQALLETLRRHSTSFEELISSPFLRMDLHRIGSVDLNSGKLIHDRKHKYKVCNVGSYLEKPHVRNFMMSVPYPAESEVVQ